MITKCIPCGVNKPKLKYVRLSNSDEKYRLDYFDNTHNHTSYCKSSKNSYDLREIVEEMKNTPRNTPITEFKEKLKAKFGIS